MKCIIFDSGTLITLTMDGLLHEFRGLKKIFDGKFIITKEVKAEVIDKPLTIKIFELEGLQIKELLDEGIIEMPSSVGIRDDDISKSTQDILKVANSTFQSKGENIHLLDLGETSCLALSRMLTDKGIKNIIAVDERTTRMLGENPENLRKLIQGKVHSDVTAMKANYKFFENFRFIRSAELAYVAYKKKIVNLKNGVVLDALLYASRYHGCSISEDEIKEIKEL
ncbi:MAG TPA: hypothetical protein VMC80_02800 [Patescibacteria group bacterium]|nr:hypothetical protein [Patescibacteria group bacterium]